MQVALMLPPFHPEYYTYMTQTELYTKILMVEPVVQQIAETCGVRLFGSFDPSKCGLSALDFLRWAALLGSGNVSLFIRKSV